MANIADVKRFKEISQSDNILVKELDSFKRTTYEEIAETVLKYIDIEAEIQNVISQRSVFFDTFLERGISPYFRMVCDAQILDESEKTLLLVQRTLSANQKKRYENIDLKYLSNAILEITIESFPSEIVDRAGWRIEQVDSPLLLSFRRSTAINLQQSYVMISNITLGRPLQFCFRHFNSNNVWSPVFNKFSGHIEPYGSTTGLDGYEKQPFVVSDSYLRLVSSKEEIVTLAENVRRSKLIDLRKNNILKPVYVQEDENGTPSVTLEGIDLEFGVSSIPSGKGVSSLGVNLIRKDELVEDSGFRIGSHAIGMIKVSYNKSHKGLEEFVFGNFICASVDSDKEYLSKDYPYFVSRYSITTNTFKVKDYVFKVNNPYDLPMSKFSGFELSHTTKTEEYGTVNSGKASFKIPSLSEEVPKDVVAGSPDSDIPSGINPLPEGDMVSLQKMSFSKRVDLILEPGSGVKVYTVEDFLDNGEFVQSRSKHNRTSGDLSSYFTFKEGASRGSYVRNSSSSTEIIGSAVTNRKPSLPVIFYVPIGFI